MSELSRELILWYVYLGVPGIAVLVIALLVGMRLRT